MAEQIGRLEIERADLRIEAERAAHDRDQAEEGMRGAGEAMEALRLDRTVRDAALAGARADRDATAQEFRARERELAGIVARLKSLEELDAARAGYGDGARLVLAESSDGVAQLGSVADFLDVDSGYERAVEACWANCSNTSSCRLRSRCRGLAGSPASITRDAVGFLVAGTLPSRRRQCSTGARSDRRCRRSCGSAVRRQAPSRPRSRSRGLLPITSRRATPPAARQARRS